MKKTSSSMLFAVVVVMMLFSSPQLIGQQQTRADAPAAGSAQPFIIEYYYKVKWGHAGEFLTLFKKNHLPLLQKEVQMGRMLQVTAVTPRYHTTEDGRWDYRVTIVFKNATVANENFDEATLARAALSRSGDL